jgi:hypothetical protein
MIGCGAGVSGSYQYEIVCLKIETNWLQVTEQVGDLIVLNDAAED